MVADIAHELCTPLAILQGQLDGIQDGIFPLSQEEIASLSQETGVLSRLVEDLRTLSLAEMRRLTLELKPMELVDFIRQVFEGFDRQASARDVTIMFHPLPDATWIEADAIRLYQIFVNVLTNALHHTPDGGIVSLTLALNGRHVDIIVSDTGPGIPDEVLPHVFDRFYRVEAGRYRVNGASGLGLTIVKALLDIQNGSISAASLPGGGAVFRLTLLLTPSS